MLKCVMAATMLLIAPGIAAAQTPAPAAQTSTPVSTLAAPAKPALPSDLTKRRGWSIIATKHSYAELNKRLEEAVKKNKMAIVNSASASDGAKAQGFTIPGNRVAGVFRNDFARRMLATSIAAGIEAPIRIYVTEGADGMATLSYRTPSAVFATYVTRRKKELGVIARELDAIFAQIAIDAAGS